MDYEPYGQHVDVLRAHALNDNPHSKITFFAGFKPNPDDFQCRRIEAYQRAGFEIDFLIMPEVDKRTDYFDSYAFTFSGILLDKPPEGHFRDDTHHYVFANSISGRSFVRSLLDDRFAKDIGKDYTGGIASAAHFSSPFRSSRLLNAVYPTYARLFWNFPNGKAPLDWAFPTAAKIKSKLKGGTGENASYVSNCAGGNAPTHGQIMSSVWTGEALEKEVHELGVSQAAKDFPMVMMAGTEDFVSDAAAIERIAGTFEAKFFQFNANHDLILQSREAQQFALMHMHNAATNRDQKLAAEHTGFTLSFD